VIDNHAERPPDVPLPAPGRRRHRAGGGRAGRRPGLPCGQGVGV